MTERTWEDAAAFHGHICPGLMIGYQAARLAERLLDLEYSKDEEVVCIAENDACGIDAIQVLLGCSVGRGNLLFRIRGKSAYSFYRRRDGRSLRLLLRPYPHEMSREESFAYLRDADPATLFEVQETRLPLPERARLFGSHPCDSCGERTAEAHLRLSGGKKLCLDCYSEYRRFDI